MKKKQTHERNELVLRRAQRDRSTTEDKQALLSARDLANEAWRTSQRNILIEVTNQGNVDQVDQADDNYGDGIANSRVGEEHSGRDVGAPEEAFVVQSTRGVDDRKLFRVKGNDRVSNGTNETYGYPHNEQFRKPQPGRKIDWGDFEATQHHEVGNGQGGREKRGHRRRKKEDETPLESETGVQTTTRKKQNQPVQGSEGPPPPPPPQAADRRSGDTQHAERLAHAQMEPDLPVPSNTASINQKARGGSFSSPSERRRGPHGEEDFSISARKCRETEVTLPESKATAFGAILEGDEAVIGVAKIGSWGDNEESSRQGGGRRHPVKVGNIRDETDVWWHSGPNSKDVLDQEAVDDGESYSNRQIDHARPWEKGNSQANSVDRPLPILSVPATAKAISALIRKIERLAAQSIDAGKEGEVLPSLASSLILNGYGSTGAVQLSKRHAAISKAAAVVTVEGPTTGIEGKDDLEEFGLNTLCGAVLDLVAAQATEILPGDVLSGLVSAEKVRAQHRRRGLPGRIRLFDALVSHVGRLAASGDVDSSAIAGVFASSFEPITAGVSDFGAERLRRKAFAFLESATGLSGVSSTIIFSATPAVAAVNILPVIIPDDLQTKKQPDSSPAPQTNKSEKRVGSDDDEFAERKKATLTKAPSLRRSPSELLSVSTNKAASWQNGTESATTAHTIATEEKTKQHFPARADRTAAPIGVGAKTATGAEAGTSQWGSITTIGSGVVLGGSGRAGRRKKEGIDLSAMLGGSFSSSGLGGLPEFEVGKFLGGGGKGGGGKDRGDC